MTDETRPTDPAGSPTGQSPFAAASGPGQPSAGSPFGSPSATPPAFAAPPAPVVVPPTKKRSTAGLLVNVLLGVALVVAVGGVAFAAGRATAPTTTDTGRFGNAGNGGNGFALGPNASGAPNRGGFGGGAFGGAGVTLEGTVTAVAADSITLQLASGQSITIPTSDTTTYHSQTAATSSDVTSGATVKVELSGGRFVGNGNGNGGGQNGGPAASGAPTRGLGSASSITVVPAGG